MKKNYLSMTKHKLLKVVCLTLIFSVLGVQTSVAQTYCQNSNGAGYENWRDLGTPTDGRTQTSCMTLGTNNTFSAEWENIFNYLGRRGVEFNPSQDPSQIGWITANYGVEYYPSCEAGSNSYMGLYGWAKRNGVGSPDDLIEWYIIEAWCNYTPAISEPILDTVVINGYEYDIVKGNRWGQPSIEGDRDFVQYFSVRRDSNIIDDPIGNVFSSYVDVSQHFEAWEEAGLPMGNINEVSMLIEGYGHGPCGEAQSQADVDANGRCKNTPNGTGSANFTSLGVNVDTKKYVTFGAEAYCLSPNTSTLLSLVADGVSGAYPSIEVVSDNTGLATTSGNEATKQYVTAGGSNGTTTLRLLGPGDVEWDTATLYVGATPPTGVTCAETRLYAMSARGTSGAEQLQVTLNGTSVGSAHNLSTSFQTYTGFIYGDGEVGVEFLNDAAGRDVRLDYIIVDGEKRETESIANNGAAYANGACGGGGYTEWLHCSGAVTYGEFDGSHTITFRARGNAGGEHIDLLIDGQPVNGGWWLGTGFQIYSVEVVGDGDINIEFDNDGGLKDVVIDWVKVDNQNPRQAENMYFNTGAHANGQCGGGHYSEWLHCNGRIGFGNISDNFN